MVPYVAKTNPEKPWEPNVADVKEYVIDIFIIDDN